MMAILFIFIVLILVIGIGVALYFYFRNKNRCTTNADCPTGQVCNNGTCVVPPDPVPPVNICTQDADCPTGQICNNGRCGIPPIPSCTQDTDCPTGKICNNGRCQQAQCGPDLPCPDQQQCDNGRCIPVPIPTRECERDWNCKPWQFCSVAQGKCQYLGCQTNEHCNIRKPFEEEEIATSSVCVNDVCQPKSCTSFRDCLDGEACVGGLCYPNATICQTDKDCFGGSQKCSTILGRSQKYCVQCTEDADCVQFGPNSACYIQGGVCL
jgi:Cys-rich repeat protein